MRFRREPGRKSDAPSHCRKRRCPKEYQSWVLWEVGLPIATPLLLVATLFVFYWGANETNALAKAFISISGTGDLLIFSALLLINAGAKFRILDLPTRSKRDLEAGDLNPDLPTWSAFFLLVAYAVIRVALDMKDVQNPALFKFLYGIGTLLILSIVFLWIDNLVRRMHTKQLTHRLEAGLIESQYNF